MKQDIKVVDYKQPVDLLNESLVISFNDRDLERITWFKVIECGEKNGKLFISGYDRERMNMLIFIDEIEYVFITR